MARTNRIMAIAFAFVMASSSALVAQAPPAGGAPPPAGGAPPAGANPNAPKTPVKEPKLMFDREVFNYGGSDRRDPFKPLLGKESVGPLFEDLKLKGVIYSSDARMSIALVQDGAKRIYRLHRGDVVGNSRITDIQPTIVKVTVENFGMLRNEVLELRVGAADAAGVKSGPATPANQPISSTARNAPEAKRMLDSLNAARKAQQPQQPPIKQNNQQEDRL